MKTLRTLSSALIASFILSVAAYASDPSGSWSWTTEGRNGSREVSAEFQLKDGTLTGSIEGRNRSTPIEKATYEEGIISFQISIGRDGRTRTMSYEGKVDGDSIVGTIERPGRKGDAPPKTDWKATKKK